MDFEKGEELEGEKKKGWGESMKLRQKSVDKRIHHREKPWGGMGEKMGSNEQKPQRFL